MTAEGGNDDSPPAGLDRVAQLMHRKGEAIGAFNAHGEIVYANEAYDALFAPRFPNGTIGANLIELDPDRTEFLEGVLAANRARTPDDENELVIESLLLDGAGQPQWIEWHYMQAFDEHGEFDFAIAMSTNRTEKRLAELRARRATDRLRESNRDLLEFAQVASHDLQEPLRKVTAFSGRLESKLGGDLDDQAQDYMRRMNSAVERMQNLIEDLLTFARVTTRGAAMVRLPLGPIVDDVLADLEVAIEKSGAAVHVGPMPSLPVDESQMRQLFQNLIGNALKFSKPDVTPKLVISAEHILPTTIGADEPPMGWYDIEVQDNGIGFDSQYAKKIFAPFQRLHGRSEYEGTGVGLSVCRRIVERHQGDIIAHSVPGHGSIFAVRLPTAHFTYIVDEDEDVEDSLTDSIDASLPQAA